MGDLTKNFSRSEFECSCGCGFDDVDMELVEQLQEMRDELEASITITSACRCKAHNEAVGGAKASKHLLGIAADIIVNRCTTGFVYKYLDDKYPESHGIGKYKSFVHFDVRTKKGRW